MGQSDEKHPSKSQDANKPLKKATGSYSPKDKLDKKNPPGQKDTNKG